MEISENIKYIGVNDHEIDMFEGQFPVPKGMAYNSYVILDEKVAVLDTIEIHFTEEWLAKLETALGGRKPDYLVVHHMEPDHSASIKVFADKYPEAVIVSSAMAFKIMDGYFGSGFEDRRIMVKDGSTLELGKHTLNFITAPQVHWPEVIMSYEGAEKILFSADGFGKFGANDVEEPWEESARKYYFGIVGRFGINVQAVLKKAKMMDIQKICSLHGPVLTGNIAYYMDLYDKWSSYNAETEGITIAYTSVYGHTKEAVNFLAEKLQEKGCKNVGFYDLARQDMTEAITSAFKNNKLVLATTTYNTDIFPFMHDFLVKIIERNFQSRTVAMIENGSWAPMAAKVMAKMLEESKNLEMIAPVTIKGAMNETTKAQLEELAEKLMA